MPLIQFTVVQMPTEAMRAMGTNGMIATNAQLTPRIINALNVFWMEHGDEYEEGDSFSIDVSYDA